MTQSEKIEFAKKIEEKLKLELIPMEQELVELGVKSNDLAIEYTVKNDAIRNKASELLLLQQITHYMLYFDALIEKYSEQPLKEI